MQKKAIPNLVTGSIALSCERVRYMLLFSLFALSTVVTPSAASPPWVLDLPLAAPCGVASRPFIETFDNNTAPPLCWGRINSGIVDEWVLSGRYNAVLTAPGLWFNGSEGFAVYREISGNFRATAEISVESIASPDTPPQTAWSLGGLIARDPTARDPRYDFIVLGRQTGADMQIEVKTTEGGVSQFVGSVWPHGIAAQIRLCRVDDTFYYYARPDNGSPWEAVAVPPDGLVEPVVHATMPETLQIGMIVYSANIVAPDVQLWTDMIRVDAVRSAADCTVEDPVLRR